METKKNNTLPQPAPTRPGDAPPNSRRALAVDITKINPPQPYDKMSILKRETRHEQVFDTDGSLWNVWEARATKHGFDILFGRPANSHLNPRFLGAARLIATPALVNYWETHRTDEGYVYDLPAGRSTIKRARRRLNLHFPQDRRKLWKKRANDLKTLATDAFAERYHVTKEVAHSWRFLLLGRTARPINWWQHPEALAILRDKNLKLKEAAEKLKVGTSHVHRLRQRAAQIDPALLETKVEGPVATLPFDRPIRTFIRTPFFKNQRQGEFFPDQKEFWRPSRAGAAKTSKTPAPPAAASAVPKKRRGAKHSHSIAESFRTRQMMLPFKERRSPEPKPVLFQVQDHKGVFYDVFDSRPTSHGFNLLFGFPTRMHRRIFTDFGKPGLIPTPELVAFWEQHRGELNINFDLPAGHTTLVRARSKLAFNQLEDYKAKRVPEVRRLRGNLTRQPKLAA